MGGEDTPGDTIPAVPMADETPETAAHTPSPEDVTRTLERLKAGVRQRRSERAALGDGGEGAELALVELKSRELVVEPVPVSPRPGIGRLLVFLRKVFFHLGFKWYARPVRESQNAFNESASRLIQDLSRRAEELGREVERLHRRLAELEAREERDRSGDEP